MEIQAREPMVLARIPDVGADRRNHDGGSDAAIGRGRLSSGRWIGQLLSFRLLAGVTMCLLVAAVLPYVFRQSPAATESPVGSNSPVGWQSDPSKDLGDAKAGTRTALKDATLVRAAAESPPPQRVAERQPVAGGVGPGNADQTPTWSQWPNPHQVEYEADARAHGTSQEPRRGEGKP